MLTAGGWVGVALFGVCAVVVLFVVAGPRALGKQRRKAKIKGFGVTVETEASSDVAPGISIENASSTHGGLRAEDQTGRGTKISSISVRDDIQVVNAVAKDGTTSLPKA